jgi:FlaA1/EpsC-like NDP-sugar epimerase
MKIFKRTATTRILFFLFLDIILISLSVYLSFLLRFEGAIPERYSITILVVIGVLLFFSLPIFYFLKLYSFSWAYVSAEELVALFKGVFLSFLFLGVPLFIFKEEKILLGFPRSTYFISAIFTFLFCGAIRFSKRIYSQIFRMASSEEKLRTLIVGAGDKGEQFLRSIRLSPESVYLPIGFVDDSPVKQGVAIHGLDVLGKIKDIPKVVRENQIEEIIIALPSGSKSIEEAVEMGRNAKVTDIEIVDMIRSEILLRRVEVEDLLGKLGRKPISLDTKSIEIFIRNKVVLITGAAGSIGSELSRQIAKFKPSLLLLLDQDETGIFNISEELKDKFPKLKISSIVADIQDEEKINQIFRNSRPHIVFHAAAYKHVSLMELCPDEAVKNNIFGTEIVAATSLKYGVEKFIFISTDKAINPTSVMGATKRMGEMICQALNQKNNTKFISVRFGNVLDSRGSVIPIFRDKIKKREAIEVTHPEMKRYFMLISEACLLVMQSGAMGKGGEVFVLDMGKPIKILDLAKEMIKSSGLEPDRDIPVVFTGVRPGEKLFEEILTTEEETIATKNQKIFIAKLSEVNERNLNHGLEKLKKAVKNSDKEEIITILKKIVPTYKSAKNLDKI